MLAKLAGSSHHHIGVGSYIIEEDCPTVQRVEVLEDHADFLTFLTQSTGQPLKCTLPTVTCRLLGVAEVDDGQDWISPRQVTERFRKYRLLRLSNQRL